jgi:hypothetical protein
VTWNGTLVVQLINGFTPQIGQTFNLFDFDASKDLGMFSSMNLPFLSQGKFWRTDQLYVDGTIRVSVTANSFNEWRTGFAAGVYTADDDGDGVANGIEFLLGTNPKVASSRGAPITELRPAEGATRTASVTFDIPADPPPDAHYRVRASSDLLSWTTIASKDGGGPWIGTAAVTTEPPLNGLTKITISESLPLSTTRRFHRLEGEAP